jgi:hypothetical protein
MLIERRLGPVAVGNAVDALIARLQSP